MCMCVCVSMFGYTRSLLWSMGMSKCEPDVESGTCVSLRAYVGGVHLWELTFAHYLRVRVDVRKEALGAWEQACEASIFWDSDQRALCCLPCL